MRCGMLLLGLLLAAFAMQAGAGRWAQPQGRRKDNLVGGINRALAGASHISAR